MGVALTNFASCVNHVKLVRLVIVVIVAIFSDSLSLIVIQSVYFNTKTGLIENI